MIEDARRAIDYAEEGVGPIISRHVAVDASTPPMPALVTSWSSATK